MFIYEDKKSSDTAKHLYFAETVPTDADTRVTYKDADGAAVTDLTFTESYLDDGNGGVVRAKDKKHIKAYAGDVRLVPQPFETEDDAED